MTILLGSLISGDLASALRLVALVLLAYGLVLWLGAVVWVYRDIRNRTTDQNMQMLSVILVAVFNVPGLIVYLVIRPQSTLSDAYERSLEAEAILHELQLTANSCQNCRRPIDDDFNICPHCRIVLREACRSCGRPVRTSWAACPYCAAERTPSRMQPLSNPQSGEGLQPPRRAAATQRRPQAQPAPPRDDQGLPRRPTPQQIDS